MCVYVCNVCVYMCMVYCPHVGMLNKLMMMMMIVSKSLTIRHVSLSYGRGMSTPSKRVNSQFLADEAVWIVLQYGALRNVTAVRLKFWHSLSEEEQRSL